jgi:broad specificity phosphatase PhoE
MLVRSSNLKTTKQLPMQITLIRHGQPSFHFAKWISAKNLVNTIDAYDAAEISGTPPLEAKKLASTHRIVVCSNLPRSISSAQALGFDNIHSGDALFQEISMPYFSTGSLKLPISTWVILLRVLWLFGFKRNGESLTDARIRAKQAAQLLIELATNHEKVLLVGHGLMNRFIAKELLSNNWDGPNNPGSRYWAYSTYSFNQ